MRHRSIPILLSLLLGTGCPGGGHDDDGADDDDADDDASDDDGGGDDDTAPPIPVCEDAGGGATVQTPVLRATLPASWDENWFASPGVADLDEDGSPEIVAARHSVLYVWGADGALRWLAPWGEEGQQGEAHGSSRSYCSPVVGDLDGDGDGEIVGVSGTHAYLYDHDGHVVQTYPFGDSELRSLAAADLDGDGTAEILVVKTGDGPVTQVFELHGDARPGWPQVDHASCDPCSDYGGYNQNVGAGDLDGDGDLEVISTYDCCHVGAFHDDGAPVAVDGGFAAAGPWWASVPMFHDLALAQQGWGPDMEDRDEFTDSPPVIADVDADGHAEVVLLSDHERAGEYVNRGNCLWVLERDMTRAPGFETPICTGEPLFTGYQDNIVQVAPAPAVADLHPAAGLEIVAPSYDGRLYAFGADGTLLWTHRFDDPGDPFVGASEPLIADVSADGVPEVLFTTYAIEDDISALVVLDQHGSVQLSVPLHGRGSMAPPTLADLDGDGQPELIVSLKDTLGGGAGGVQIWDWPGARDNCLLWATGRGDPLRRGWVPSGD